MTPSEEFGQIRLKFTDPIQHDYEVIRPIVLFSETIAERSRQTSLERTRVGDKARRFVQHGMFGLADQRAGTAGRTSQEYPEAVATEILSLKQLYPPIHYREIVRIIERKFGYKTNHHTIKSFLDRHPIPVQLELDFTPFHDFEDAYQARWTVVRMHAQGWNKRSIAGCLKLSPQHVHDIIDAFEQDGFAGLEDHRTRPINHPANQLTLPFLKLEDQWTYSICLIEGYSRTILVGTASEHQDLTVVLQILFAALSEYGCPEVIVSDNAKVFNAHHYLAILAGLEIDPKYIEKGKPWQNLIEAQFKIELRLADFKFEQAQTFEQIQQVHAQFVDTFNTTPHYAHREREDGRRTPAQVLAWVRGRRVEPERLRRLFWYVQFTRLVNRYGFVSVQRFYIYAEQGLSRQRVSIWVYEGNLQIEYQETLLARYQGDYDWHQNHLQEVSQPTLYRMPFVSPQLEMFELDNEQWLKVRQRSYQRQQKYIKQGVRQLPLTGLEIAI